jgi:hypothetical protein
MWGIDGFHVVDLLTRQQIFTSQDVIANVMTPLVFKVLTEGKCSHALQLHSHFDNSRVNFSNISVKFQAENEIVRVLQPLKSPDLAPSDFWLLGQRIFSVASMPFGGDSEG